MVAPRVQAGRLAAKPTVTKPLLKMLAAFADEFLGAAYDTLMRNVRRVTACPLPELRGACPRPLLKNFQPYLQRFANRCNSLPWQCVHLPGPQCRGNSCY